MSLYYYNCIFNISLKLTDDYYFKKFYNENYVQLLYVRNRLFDYQSISKDDLLNIKDVINKSK